jgi:hypothetical protein
VPGFQALDYDILGDGTQVVMEAEDAEGKPRLWLASGRSSPPRQIPNVEGRTPRFGPTGEIYFLGNAGSVYSVRQDGTGVRKALEQEILSMKAVSPDGRWIVAWVSIAGGGVTLQAFPLDGIGSPVTITSHGFAVWSPSGESISITIPEGRSYLIPLAPGQALPRIPAGGFHSEQEVLRLPGARRIEEIKMVPGPSPDVYAFYRTTIQRNLYRIPIP